LQAAIRLDLIRGKRAAPSVRDDSVTLSRGRDIQQEAICSFGREGVIASSSPPEAALGAGA